MCGGVGLSLCECVWSGAECVCVCVGEVGLIGSHFCPLPESVSVWKCCVCVSGCLVFYFLTRVERIYIGLKLASFIVLVHDYIQRTRNLIVQNKK